MAIRVFVAWCLALLWLVSGELAAQEPVLHFERADGRPLDAQREWLSVSRHITHDASLPRAEAATSDDPGNFRLVAEDDQTQRDVLYAWLEARRLDGSRRGLLRHVPLHRMGRSTRFRSPWLRLVSDATDLSAPDVRDRLLQVALRDRVRAGLGSGARVPTAEIAVRGQVSERSAEPVLTGQLRITVLRLSRERGPVVGDDEAAADQLAREQVEIANEVWAQCGIEFGDPRAVEVQIADVPPPALLAFGDIDGLPARGDGRIEILVGGVRVGPIATVAGDAPRATAERVAHALRKAGFVAEVSENPRCEKGAGPSADVIVRDQKGRPLSLTVPGNTRTDSQQSMQIGRLDLGDGLKEFDNIVAAAGTLEERTLIKLLGDGDPQTIDLFIINSFVTQSRQGEAFIEADQSPLANTIIIDRNAVRFQRQAWVSAHELGHVLLDEALHPDNVGQDRPWLLMDADARQGRVNGPKRLSDDDCNKARRRSGPGAKPVLLRELP